MVIVKLDFGSGHNPKKGYYSCDITGNPKLDFHYEIDTGYIVASKSCPTNLVYAEWVMNDCRFTDIHIRNVIHHVKDLEHIFKNLKHYLTKDGVLTIIDCNEECYQKNLNLDILWYRYLIPRYDIYICKEYRNIEPILEGLGFKLISKKCKDEKITYKWRSDV